MKLPSKKLAVKIIALDLDDTLLTADLNILPRTVDAVRKATAQSIYMVLCSGRAENAILPYVRALAIAGSQFGRYLIAMNGASIYDLHLRQQIYKREVPIDILQFTYQEAKKRALVSQVYDASTIFASGDNEWVRLDKKLSGLNLQVVSDYDNFLNSGFPKIVVPGEPEAIKDFEIFLKEKLNGRARVFTSKPYFLEVMPQDCGKGEALLWLSQKLDIPQIETMAFGDSYNDASMISLANYGVAMCNGVDDIKTMAKFITRYDNENDGIADFLEEFVLN